MIREVEWRRLMVLLEPIHDEARGMARKLAPSPGDGDDLFQDALLRAYDKLTTLRDETRFRSWFYAVLLSVHRTRCRRSFWKRFLSLEGEREKGYDPVGEEGADRIEENIQAGRIARALATLPAVQREAVVLFELEDFAVEEIAGMQNVSPSTVKSRISRGRERLRRYYERLGFGREPGRPVRRKRKRPEGEDRFPESASGFAWASAMNLSREEKL